MFFASEPGSICSGKDGKRAESEAWDNNTTHDEWNYRCKRIYYNYDPD